MMQLVRTTHKSDPIGDLKPVQYWYKLRTWLSNNTMAKKLAMAQRKNAVSATPEVNSGDEEEEESEASTPRHARGVGGNTPGTG